MSPPQTPVLPPTITDQIRLWELERDRLQFTEGEHICFSVCVSVKLLERVFYFLICSFIRTGFCAASVSICPQQFFTTTPGLCPYTLLWCCLFWTQKLFSLTNSCQSLLRFQHVSIWKKLLMSVVPVFHSYFKDVMLWESHKGTLYPVFFCRVCGSACMCVRHGHALNDLAACFRPSIFGFLEQTICRKS